VSAYIADLVEGFRAPEQTAGSEIRLEQIVAPKDVSGQEIEDEIRALEENADAAVEHEEIAETVIELEEVDEVPVEYEALVEPGPDGAGDDGPPGRRGPSSSSSRPRRRGRRLLIAAVALGSLATAGSLAVSQGDNGSSGTAPEQVATDPPQQATEAPAASAGSERAAEPAAEPRNQRSRFAVWSGNARVTYEDGTKDEMTVSLRIGPLEPGKEVGTAKMVQNGTECSGTLTSLGRVDGVFRFSYRERNTSQCVARGRITLTPAGEGRLAYEEKTEISVNRGTLTRD